MSNIVTQVKDFINSHQCSMLSMKRIFNNVSNEDLREFYLHVNQERSDFDTCHDAFLSCGFVPPLSVVNNVVETEMEVKELMQLTEYPEQVLIVGTDVY